MSVLSIVLLFCTQFTFDLILRPRDNFRLNIHPYRFYYTYINIFSMDASFYPILEAGIGVLGIQDICHFTSRDIGYYPFYFQVYGVLDSIFLLLPGILKI